MAAFLKGLLWLENIPAYGNILIGDFRSPACFEADSDLVFPYRIEGSVFGYLQLTVFFICRIAFLREDDRNKHTVLIHHSPAKMSAGIGLIRKRFVIVLCQQIAGYNLPALNLQTGPGVVSDAACVLQRTLRGQMDFVLNRRVDMIVQQMFNAQQFSRVPFLFKYLEFCAGTSSHPCPEEYLDAGIRINIDLGAGNAGIKSEILIPRH